MRLPHHPEVVDALRRPTAEEPWKILISGCLHGWKVVTDGRALPELRPGWLQPPLVELVPFCPENYRLGTPRTMPDLHGGDGFDVLDGTAKVLDEHREDLTSRVLEGAHAMVALAREHDVDFALLLDRSGTCGSQVISVGCRLEEPIDHRKGVGVAAAAMLRAGFHVVSQRDFRTLELLHAKLDPGHTPDPEALDHHRHPWVLEHLG
ncbi:MAG: 2-thiouracil desulfurase family protein [Myxococcota bacterium]